MTIGEIIDCLNRRESIAIIAKRLEISPYTLSKKLRLIGYEYDGEQKKRIFVGDEKNRVTYNSKKRQPFNMRKRIINY